MKLFKSIQNHFAVVGISSFYANQTHLLNAGNITATITFGLTFITKGMFLVHGAEKFEEYISSFFVVSSLVAIIAGFEILIWKMRNLFELIDKLEKAVNKSKT